MYLTQIYFLLGLSLVYCGSSREQQGSVREFDCQDIQVTIVSWAVDRNFKSILFIYNEETTAIAVGDNY